MDNNRQALISNHALEKRKHEYHITFDCSDTEQSKTKTALNWSKCNLGTCGSIEFSTSWYNSSDKRNVAVTSFCK